MTLASSSDCTASNVRMMSDHLLEVMWEGSVWPNVGYAVLLYLTAGMD